MTVLALADTLAWGALVALDVVTARPEPVYPSQGSGYAAGLLGGFFALGIITFALIVLSRRPPAQRHE